ncbi:hypothetical protein [Maricaulis parjimensis]|uniref:hypothetical protein n=1 Tax=Maricaulis parjimensis TaxID=144023 RepID=UPI00193A791A|nr:hypothetical protein [Maricaulis parjimensis]
MKTWIALSGLTALALIAACSAPEPADTEVSETGAGSVFSEDNLASSEACFADAPSTLLEPGQTLIERGPSGIVRVSHNLDAAPADYEFAIISLSEPQRRIIDDAGANFFRAAGDAHDYATDEVIYHRSRDGTFCAVVRDEAVGSALAEAAATVQADIDATPPASQDD